MTGEFPDTIRHFFAPELADDPSTVWISGERAPKLDSQFALPGIPAAIEQAWIEGDEQVVLELIKGRDAYQQRYDVSLGNGIVAYPTQLGRRHGLVSTDES